MPACSCFVVSGAAGARMLAQAPSASEPAPARAMAVNLRNFLSGIQASSGSCINAKPTFAFVNPKNRNNAGMFPKPLSRDVSSTWLPLNQSQNPYALKSWGGSGLAAPSSFSVLSSSLTSMLIVILILILSFILTLILTCLVSFVATYKRIQ